MMKINVLQIKKEVGGLLSFEFVTSADQLDLTSEQPWIGSEIRVIGQVYNQGAAFVVDGSITFTAFYVCDRCLQPFSKPVKIVFTEDYREGTDVAPDDDSETSYYYGDEIDIDAIVRENIILSEPLQKLCKEDCCGLCVSCGTDLNTTPCSCLHEKIDPRLVVLKNLLIDK